MVKNCNVKIRKNPGGVWFEGPPEDINTNEKMRVKKMSIQTIGQRVTTPSKIFLVLDMGLTVEPDANHSIP